MLARILQVKVNFVVVFGGAALIILLIKLTPYLLPAKYYFNFSKLLAADTTPLIVDPPAVTGAKLCEIMARNKIPKDMFGRTVSCNASFENVLSPDEVDKVYSIALRSDQAVRDAFATVLQQQPIKPLTDADIKAIAAKSATAEVAFEAIFNEYAGQIREIVAGGPGRAIEALYSGVALDSRSTDDTDTAAGGGLPADLVARVTAANERIAAALGGAVLAQKIPAIRKSAVDDIVRRVQTSGGGLESNVTDYYTTGVLTALRDAMTRGFSDLGLAPGKDADKKIVFDEINRFSWRNYVLAILLRLTPVFLIGLVAGAAAGRAELFSIGLAGALAAFLLSWPLMLMWDTLVQSGWSDKKPIFFALYAVYMISFFVTARSAALLGVWLRERDLVGLASPSSMEVAGLGLRVTWREVAINITGALVLNSMVYAWNLFIPLSATNPQ